MELISGPYIMFGALRAIISVVILQGWQNLLKKADQLAKPDNGTVHG